MNIGCEIKRLIFSLREPHCSNRTVDAVKRLFVYDRCARWMSSLSLRVPVRREGRLASRPPPFSSCAFWKNGPRGVRTPNRGDACAMDALGGISNSGRDAVCTREGTAVRSLPKLTPPRPNGLITRAGDEAGTRFRWVQTGRMVQGGRLRHHRSRLHHFVTLPVFD
jgi:hypothetical protein